MKKVFCGLLLLSIVFALFACNGTNPDTPTQPPSTGQGAAPLSVNDMLLIVGGTVFRLDDAIGLVTDALGTDYEFSESISCEYEGMDKIFAYEGVEFYTYPVGEKDFLHEIALTAPKYQTARGIAVGDSAERVAGAYGEDYDDQDGIWVYPADSGALWFYFTGDTVRSVSLSKDLQPVPPED